MLRSGLVTLAAALALSACTGAPATSSATTAPASGSPAASAPTPAVAAPTTPSPAAPLPTISADTRPLTGRTIVVDPGHNGVWTRALLRQVPAGNGRTKACNASGTASNAGYPEHAFAWDVATRLRTALRRLGATVVLTRPNDRGSGPCVNARAAITNKAKADLLVSIHADGSFAAGARGFHVIVSTTMAGGARVEQRSLAFAKVVRHAIETGTGMPRSTYIGAGTGLSPRSDIAGLNLSQRVGVMVEFGNMRSAADLKLLGSAAWRQRAAAALAAACVTTLAR